jgi:acyl-CoA dehydrogenase
LALFGILFLCRSICEVSHYATVIPPKLTIQGGTTEILRGIIARGLGLR